MDDLELDWNDASNQEMEILKATAGMSYAGQHFFSFIPGV
jgi:hypothetical protein